MADAPTRVGRYEIIDLVGQGGMGRVYRARDTQLARTVAVKVLPEAFAADSDYLRRFEQEARATAALSHPGVLSIYDVGTHAGAPYLVSELLEGTTLRARLTSGKLPIDKALDFGVQAAHALAAAHARGIVHRDLKPENLFVSPADRITILDFGLAKLTPTATADQTFIDVTGTLGNAIIGTPSYMAPEQARGEKVDHRADIFSLGCILYEMLNGRRAFDGNTPADVLSAILRDTPPHLTSSVEQPMSPAVDRLVQRCLAKDPNARFQSASDLAFALENVGNAEAVPVQAEHRVDRRPSIGWKTAALVLAAIGALTAAAAAAILLRRPAPVPDIVEFHVPAPANESFAPMPLQGLLPTAPQVGLSPDGKLLAFVTVDSGGRRRLWIRSLDDSRARAVDGADGATSWPFWSPDSRHLVVAAGRALLKVDTGKDTVERLTTLPDNAPPVPFVTGTWNEAGTILFSVGGRTGIYRTDASGSAPQPVTTIDDARGDDYHSWPQFLPDGRFLVFVRTAKADTNGTYAGSLDSKELRAVQSNPSRAIYARGQLLWAIEDKLVAQPFDTSALRLSGEPVTLVPSIFQGAGRTPGFWVSDGGDLVYAPGDTRERQFRWHSRAGNCARDRRSARALRDVRFVPRCLDGRGRGQQGHHGAPFDAGDGRHRPRRADAVDGRRSERFGSEVRRPRRRPVRAQFDRCARDHPRRSGKQAAVDGLPARQASGAVAGGCDGVERRDLPIRCQSRRLAAGAWRRSIRSGSRTRKSQSSRCRCRPTGAGSRTTRPNRDGPKSSCRRCRSAANAGRSRSTAAFSRRGAATAASCTSSASMAGCTASRSGPAPAPSRSARRRSSFEPGCPSSAPSSNSTARPPTDSGSCSACLSPRCAANRCG